LRGFRRKKGNTRERNRQKKPHDWENKTEKGETGDEGGTHKAAAGMSLPPMLFMEGGKSELGG